MQQGLTTDFEQNSLTSYEGSSLYNRSDAGNWTNGFPVNGGTVVLNVPYANLSNTLSNISGLTNGAQLLQLIIR